MRNVECDSFQRHFDHDDLSNLPFVRINIRVNTKIDLNVANLNFVFSLSSSGFSWINFE